MQKFVLVYEPMLISQIEGLASSPEETDYLLKLLSWSADEQYRVALLKHPSDDKEFVSGDVASELQAIEDNLVTAKAFFHNNAIVCVINNSRAESFFADNLILHFCERFGWKAAVSNSAASFSSLQSLYNRVLATFDIGCQLSPKTILYHFDDYRLLLIFSAIKKSGYADFLLHDDLIALAQYDVENDSDMVNTLKTYLDLERNSSKTADALHLHRNSVTYRLEKIKSLMTSDLDEPENRLLLTLSIYYLQSQQDG